MSDQADTDPDDTDPDGAGQDELYPPIRETVTLLATDWPAADAPVRPCTERRPFPMGFGGSGTVMMPWDQVDDVMQRGGYYGFQPHQLLDPYAEAPRTDPRGGLIFFDSDIERADFDVMLRLLGVHRRLAEYGAFLQEAENPLEQGFLSELRAFSSSALARIDGRAREQIGKQPLELGELLWRFVDEQQGHRGTDMNPDLYGTFGGDGDWAKEALCFGLMVESADLGVYRLWSRAWLVTK